MALFTTRKVTWVLRACVLDEVWVELVVPDGVEWRRRVQTFAIEAQLQHLRGAVHRTTAHRQPLRLTLNNNKHLKNVGPIRYCEPFYIVIHQVSLLPPLSHAACSSMSTTTTTTTTRDRRDRYGSWNGPNEQGIPITKGPLATRKMQYLQNILKRYVNSRTVICSTVYIFRQNNY